MYQEFTSDSPLKAEMKVLLFVNTIGAKALQGQLVLGSADS